MKCAQGFRGCTALVRFVGSAVSTTQVTRTTFVVTGRVGVVMSKVFGYCVLGYYHAMTFFFRCLRAFLTAKRTDIRHSIERHVEFNQLNEVKNHGQECEAASPQDSTKVEGDSASRTQRRHDA